MFLQEKLIVDSFRRLAESTPTDKRGMERTSCLMYFLAFDELAKSHGRDVILLDPNSPSGLANRDDLTARYSKLVRAGWGEADVEWYVSNLGEINTDGRRTSEDRISADFLTTPLKKASEAAEPQGHPRRPKPLLLLGIEVCQTKWGVSCHPDWRRNIIDFVSDRVSRIPWTDLAIFVLREANLPLDGTLQKVLKDELTRRYTSGLVSFWCDKIDSESRRFSWPGEFLQERVSSALRRIVEKQSKPIPEETEILKQEIEMLKKEIDELRIENAIFKKKCGYSS